MTCGVVILAAGASTRLGTPKQLLMLNGETLLDRAVRVATEADFSPVMVVLGAFEEEIRAACKLSACTVLSNPEWRHGMGTSIALGIQAIAEANGVVVMTCDMPAVTAGHLQELAASGEATSSQYAGRKGVPAYFPRAAFPELLPLRGDAGARELLQAASCVVLQHGELDVDTPEDWAVAQRLFASINTKRL